MKYRMTRTASGTDIEIDTDHTTVVQPQLFVRREKKGIVYCFGNMRWTVEGMVELFQWAAAIDSTVTVQDVMKLCPFTLTVVDELRFYAEMDALGFSHTE